MDNLIKSFRDPPLSLRGAPFWSWNDKLDPAELTRQLRDMKAHGMGGFFMHSRDGLETVYMGAEWIECIRQTVSAAAAEGMGAWLYDEDRWPSGVAGGLVPARGGDAYRAKAITMEICDEPPEDAGEALALFIAHIDGKQLLSAQRVSPASATPSGDEALLVFRRKISPPSEWTNNDAYADNLNPDAVAAFIDITYEAYKQEIGEQFGKAVPGVFTDEPNIFAHTTDWGHPALPWTDDLPAFFRERRGHDLLDAVPWLFLDGERSNKARHDYWYTISQRFTEAYTKQIGDWCERNGLAFTGHYLLENELGQSIIRSGSTMPHYEYQHVPGIDMLLEQNHEFVTIKQCTSVANQFGRQRVLSELYGCTSWEFSFEGQKFVGDWHYVLGVNLRCQHLALYSLRGCRKRDYPPSFNYNTTWWRYNRVVEDYFARVGAVLTAGRAVRDVLVLHPTATGWSMLGEGAESLDAVDAYGEGLNAFAKSLLAIHYDFDFGDEQIMSRYTEIDGGTLQVGQVRYSVVVIPPNTQTLLASTVDLLERLLKAGGRVLAFESLPSMIEAEPSKRLANLWRMPGVTQVANVTGLQAALESATPRRVSLRNRYGQEAGELLYMERAIDARSGYFVFNQDRNHAVSALVQLDRIGRLEEWDALTGGSKVLPCRLEDGKLTFETELAATGSKLFVVDTDAEPLLTAEGGMPAYSPTLGAGRPESYIGPVCPFERTDPNVLTLDMCAYRISDSEWSPVMEVWQAQSAIREALGMRQNYYNGLPQRYKWATQPHENDGTTVELAFQFAVDRVPGRTVHLLVEGSEQFGITLNGDSVGNQPVGWYLDRSFHKVPLPGLALGNNRLILGCSYTNYMELEDCFLIGDFGVSIDRRIISEPERLHFDDWTTQGYPNYAGSMIYQGSFQYDPKRGKHVRLWLGETKMIHAVARVNGTLAGHIPWPSENGLDITGQLGPGLNNIDIEVVGSPRNMLGPLHLKAGREPGTSWSSFRTTGERFTPDYVLKAWGLYGQVKLEQYDCATE